MYTYSLVFAVQQTQLSKEDEDECKKMYIDLLERVWQAFNRIPNCIKRKLPGFDNEIYAKMKLVRIKLKSAIEPKSNDSYTESLESLQINNKSNNSLNGHASPSLLDQSDINDFDLESSQVYGKKPFVEDKFKHSDMETSTPEFPNFQKTLPTKNVYSELIAKKSLSFNAFSPCDNSSKNLESSIQSDAENVDKSDSVNKSKGKFVFKRPSKLNNEDKSTPIRDNSAHSSTLERLRSVSERLKPILPQEAPKYTPLENSSIDFQPPQLSKSSLMNLNKPCTIVSPIMKDSPAETDYEDEYFVPVDMDDDTDIIPQSSKASYINISDSLPSTSNEEIINNKDIAVDEDGWPEYRIEDFEDDIEVLTCREQSVHPGVMNLMDHTAVEDKPKYEGMGDFHAGTKNDGITGKLFSVFSLHPLSLCKYYAHTESILQ